MWPLLLIAGVAIAYLATNTSSPAVKAVKTTVANVSANWPSHIVIDVGAFSALGNQANVVTAYEGVDPRVISAMTQRDPRITTTLRGTVGMFVSAQLAAGQRVWIGTPIQDETSQIPSAYLPIYIGSDPPSSGGFVEVTA